MASANGWSVRFSLWRPSYKSSRSLCSGSGAPQMIARVMRRTPCDKRAWIIMYMVAVSLEKEGSVHTTLHECI